MAEITVSQPRWQETLLPSIKRSLGEYGLLAALVIIIIFFELATGGALLQPLNVTNLLLQNSYIVIMALGMLMVIVSGHIDLSVGSIVGVVSAIAGVLLVRLHMDVVSTTLICLLCGALIGAIQGYFIAFWSMPSFIVTLAGMLVFRGATIAVSGGQSIGPFPPSFTALSSGFLADPLQVGNLHGMAILVGLLVALAFFYVEYRARQRVIEGNGDVLAMSLFLLKNGIFSVAILYFCYILASYRGIPTVLVTMAVLIAIYTFVMNNSIFGRRLYAVGGNLKAARLSGVNTTRLVFLAFVNMGLLAGVAGLIFAARLNSATPRSGAGFELDVIAAVFIGGASASGGVGTVLGAVAGAFIMGVLNNGMSIMGIGVDYQQMIKGMVLLAAVFVDIYQKNKA